jgi:hypothetical protein
MKRSDLPSPSWGASRYYPRAEYLEVGWGDDDGYRKDFTTGIVLKALVYSRRTVLCYDGFQGAVSANYDDPKVRILAIDLSRNGFEKLCVQLGRAHAWSAHGGVIPLGDDWYRGRGTYCMLHTCNSWVAEGLRAAGCPIRPAFCQLPGALLSHVRKFGRDVPVTLNEKRVGGANK